MKIRIQPILIIFAAIFLAASTAYVNGSETDLVASGTLYLIFPLTTALIGLYTSRIYGFKSANGQALLLIAAGLTCWGIGETITYVLYLAETSFFPSPADVILLLAYLLFGAGIYQSFITANINLKIVKKPLLVAILSASLVMTILVAYFGVYSVYDSSVDLLSNIVSISYGIGDLILVILSMLAILVASEYTGGKLASFWKTIAAGFFLFLVADILFAMHGNQWSDIATDPYDIFIQVTWIAGYLTLAYGMLENYIHISTIQQRILLKIQQRKQ